VGVEASRSSEDEIGPALPCGDPLRLYLLSSSKAAHITRYRGARRHGIRPRCPRDPDLAVIEPGNANASLIMPGIGVVLVLMSMAVFYWVVPALGK
jgi:hypothetical protein